jgi:nucleoside-diphosphate-sugar epimerase
MNNPLHVIVGAGSVGTALAHQLVAADSPVRMISRAGSGPTHPSIERVAANAADAVRLTELTQGAAALYNCANPPYHRWATDWPPLASSLLTAAERTGAVLATCSNLYAYGPVDAPMTEHTPLAATGTKGRVRAQMWADALAAHQGGRLRATEVRGSDYLGATSQSMLGDTVMPRLLAGKTVWTIGDPAVPHSYTYVGDVARLLAVAAADERAWGAAWHVPSHPARPAREVIDDLADAAGVARVGARQMPGWVVRALGLAMPFLREMPEVMHQHTRPWLLDSSAAERTFGLAPTPWVEILSAHLAPYRTAGQGSRAA